MLTTFSYKDVWEIICLGKPRKAYVIYKSVTMEEERIGFGKQLAVCGVTLITMYKWYICLFVNGLLLFLLDSEHNKSKVGACFIY